MPVNLSPMNSAMHPPVSAHAEDCQNVAKRCRGNSLIVILSEAKNLNQNKFASCHVRFFVWRIRMADVHKPHRDGFPSPPEQIKIFRRNEYSYPFISHLPVKL